MTEAPASGARGHGVTFHDLFHDHIHVRLMEATAVIATIRKAIGIDDDHAEEYAILALAVRLLYRLDNDVEAQSPST